MGDNIFPTFMTAEFKELASRYSSLSTMLGKTAAIAELKNISVISNKTTNT